LRNVIREVPRAQPWALIKHQVDVGGRQCPFIAHLKELVGNKKALPGNKKTFDEMMTNAHPFSGHHTRTNV